MECCVRPLVRFLELRSDSRGELVQFTGIDDPYEPPEHPELVLDTSRLSVGHAVARILDVWERVTS